MKKENMLFKIFLVILIILFVFLLIVAIIKTNKYDKTIFSKLSILQEPIQLKDNVYRYKVDISCHEIEDNEQIINYELKDKYKDYNITIDSIFYKNEKKIKENYKEATDINIIIRPVDEKDSYPHIYFIEAKCK
jgi:hypothetical protein